MNTQDKIQKFLRSVTKTDIIVSTPRNESDCDYVVFLSKKNYDDYKLKNYDSEFIQIWSITKPSIMKSKKKFGFSFWVDDPGVYMNKDGSGTPPSSDLVEYKDTFSTIPQLLGSLCQFITKMEVTHATEIWNEPDMDEKDQLDAKDKDQVWKEI